MDVAQKTGIDAKKLSRIENGQLPGLLELRALLDLYGVVVGDYVSYEDIWQLAVAKYWWDGLGREDVVYLSMEHEANVIHDFQTTHLPVLPQTDGYLYGLLETSVLPPSSQLAHLLRRSEQDNVTVQIVPLRQPLGVTHGSFTLLSFPDKGEPDLVYTQDPISARYTQDVQAVDTIRRTFRRVTEHAMSSEESRVYVKQRLGDVIAKSRPGGARAH